jgi:hypothetical protein
MATAFASSFLNGPASARRRVGAAGWMAALAWSTLLVAQVVQAAPVSLFKEADGTMAQMGQFANVLRATSAEVFFFDGGSVGGYAPVLHEGFGLRTYYLPQVDVHGEVVPPDSPLRDAAPLAYTSSEGKRVAIVSPLPTPTAASDHVDPFFPNATLTLASRFTLTISILKPTCDVLAYAIDPATRDNVDFSRIEAACGTQPPSAFQQRSLTFNVYLLEQGGP